MTLIKSILLGSAAGLVAVAGAQAADLPTKKAAPAAAYVAICNVAGVTGFTIPGSDTCLKISGGVGVEMIYANRKDNNVATWSGVRANRSVTQAVSANNANRFGMDGRAWVTLDTATNTAYGPATSEAQLNFGADNAQMATNYGNGASLDHAWFKWAGLEGHVADGSLFNIGSNHAPTDGFGSPDIGGAAYLAYVAQFGGGFSAGLSIEDPIGHRANSPNVLAVAGPPAIPGYAVNAYQGSKYPDVAARIGVSQGWGGAQLSGIIHNTSLQASANPTNFVLNGPYSKMGYGVAAAVQFNVGSTVKFDLSGNYTYGLAKVFSQGVGATGLYQSGTGNSGGADYAISDALPLPNGGYAVPKAWGINAGVSFAASPQISVTPYASYGQLTYSADPVITSQTLKAWNVGVDATWKPVSSISVDLNVLYTSLTESVPTAAVGNPWNTKASGFLGRLQVARTF